VEGCLIQEKTNLSAMLVVAAFANFSITSSESTANVVFIFLITGRIMMKYYDRILVAADSSEQCRPILERACTFIQREGLHQKGTQLSLLQVLEHVPSSVPSDIVPPEGMDGIAWMEQYARTRLSRLAEQSELLDTEVLVVEGSPKEEIVLAAKRQHADLIVMGTHERHGLHRLHSSTTDSVVHNAPCDVLIVHTSCEVEKGGEYSALG